MAESLQGVSAIASMMSEDDVGEIEDTLSTINIDEVFGAIENTECSTIETMVVSKVRKVRQKSKAALVKTVQMKKEAIHRVFKMMQNAEEVDLCFLVDCTGSMGSYITRVKTNIKTWFERLKANYKHLKLRVSFVRYTDFDQPKSTRTTWLDFTENVEHFYSFVDAIVTSDGVGGDTAEDVFGGLEAVTKLAWRKIGTKVLIHFADAPCHGKQYHDRAVRDDYPDGDPDDRDLNEIMATFYRQEIYYHFGSIRERSTQKMISEFDKVLLERGEREMTLHTFNANKPLLIDEAVYRSISSSISASLEKKSAIDTKGKIRDFELMKSIPKWEAVETCTVKVSETVGASIALPSIPKEVKVAKQPFAKGGIRLAYHAFIPGEKRHVVMKEFLSTDKAQTCIKRFMENSIVQGTAASLAIEFNREKPSVMGIEIEFATCGIIEYPPDTDGTQRYYAYEPFIAGDYTKFNGNNGYVAAKADPVNDTCQAFSHYTWIKSERALVVCDIQGVKEGGKLILTDPAIHAKNVLKYGITNLGARGMKKFFASHKCNEICIKMRLEKSQHQLT